MNKKELTSSKNSLYWDIVGEEECSFKLRGKLDLARLTKRGKLNHAYSPSPLNPRPRATMFRGQCQQRMLMLYYAHF